MEQGQKQAWKTFQKAGKNVPAYKKFLAKNNWKGKTFSEIPCMDKKNYIHCYDLLELVSGGRTAAHISASSGSSGNPTFWVRDNKQEQAGGKFHEKIFKDIYGIDPNKPTLIIICFAMGVWVAGGFTLAACRFLAEEKKFLLTSISPGIDKADFFSIMENLAPKFEQVILAGYPPFLTDLLREAGQKKIKLSQNICLLASGEKISEQWRSLMFEAINKTPDNHSVINVYGSADVGAMAHETPLTITLHQLAGRNPKLSAQLLNGNIQTGLYQFNPKQIYFETLDGELVLTTDTASPLVRYKIHDQGQVISQTKLTDILKNNGLTDPKLNKLLRDWPWPLVAVGCRSDVAITFYSLNIFPENIREGLDSKDFDRFITGKFFALTLLKKTGQFSQSLQINLELKPGIKPSGKLKAKAQSNIFKSLTRGNMEFRKLAASLGKNALPQIKLVPYGLNIAPKNHSGLSYQRGKKAKLILKTHAK